MDGSNQFAAKEPNPMVYLNDEYTHVTITQDDIRVALDAAMWLMASPHEWTWTHEQQVAMAKYCLAAQQRLSIMSYVARAADIKHRPKGGA